MIKLRIEILNLYGEIWVSLFVTSQSVAPRYNTATETETAVGAQLFCWAALAAAPFLKERLKILYWVHVSSFLTSITNSSSSLLLNRFSATFHSVGTSIFTVFHLLGCPYTLLSALAFISTALHSITTFHTFSHSSLFLSLSISFFLTCMSCFICLVIF